MSCIRTNIGICSVGWLEVAFELKRHDANLGLDLSNLSSGIYCLIVKNNFTNHKFIIQK